MDKFYIKEGDAWLGPLSEIEFEFRKAGKDSFEYWKPEFCKNQILHPSLCSHTKTWIKSRQEEEHKFIFESSQHEEAKSDKSINFIYSDKSLETNEENADETKSDREAGMRKKPQYEKAAVNSFKPGNLFKIIVIIIGFALVIISAYYVNSKLNLLFYQDTFIQESVRKMEYKTNDIMKETKVIKDMIDSVNLRMEKYH